MDETANTGPYHEYENSPENFSNTRMYELDWYDEVMDIIVHEKPESSSRSNEGNLSVRYYFEQQFLSQRQSLFNQDIEDVTMLLSTWANKKDLDNRLRGLYNTFPTSDVLVGFPFSDGLVENKIVDHMAIFAGHRIVLGLRSSYLQNGLADIQGEMHHNDATGTEIPFVILQCSMFKPVTWEVVFQFMYTGRFHFEYSNDNFANNLSAVLSVYGAAWTFQISSLEGFAYWSIVEMFHGLFCADLSSKIAYEELLGGVWSKAMLLEGCSCSRCVHHIPLILRLCFDFSLETSALAYSARRALIAMFGVGWVTEEFWAMPDTAHSLLLNDLRRMIAPSNIFSMIFALEEAFSVAIEDYTTWSFQLVTRLFRLVLMDIDRVLEENIQAAFECPEIMELRAMSPSASRRNVSGRVVMEKKLEWVVKSLLRIVKPANVDVVRKTLERWSLIQIIADIYPDSKKRMAAMWSEKISNVVIPLFSIIHPGPNSFLKERHESMQTMESKRTSYSKASSRTVSTEYGNTRTCLSQDPLPTEENNLLLYENDLKPWRLSKEPRNSTLQQDGPFRNTSLDLTRISSWHSYRYPFAPSPSFIEQTEASQPTPGRQKPHLSLQTIDSIPTSYSIASSRTVSTEYGIYYTRWCLSIDQDDIDTVAITSFLGHK